MSAEEELHGAYSEWRRLSEAEGKAIREGNWGFVAECQLALTRLRSTIDQLTTKAGEEIRNLGLSAETCQSSRRATVLNLIELQRRNLASLQQRRQRLSAHIENLVRSNRNLRGIQRSYTERTSPAWSSYS
jgi:hypothetical protein